MKKIDDWLTSKEICQLLKISTRTLANYRAKSVLPYVKLGRKTYYNINDVNQLFESHYVKPFSCHGGAL